MAFVEVKGTRPFKKFEEADIYSDEDNKVLQLLGIQYYRIEEAVRFNEKYQLIGKGSNSIAEKLANSEKAKRVFEFVKGALTVGVIGYATINNVCITETLGSLTSYIPIIGEKIGDIMTSPSGNGIITQLLADRSFASIIEKGIEEISSRKEIIKYWAIDKLPTKIKEKYFDIENEKAEKIMKLESEYETDREAIESNRELYKRKSKEILKELFLKDEKTDKTKDNEEQTVIVSNQQVEKEEKSNPWQLSQEQIQEQRRKNEVSQSRENNSKTKEENAKQQETINI